MCRLKYKDEFNEDVSTRQICKVSTYLFDKDTILLEEFYGYRKFSINVKHDEYVEILEMTPFIDVFPYYFYPSLGVIENLNRELNDEKELLMKWGKL